MAFNKPLLVPMTVALHTKLKWRAQQEGRSMADIIRSLVADYVEGEIEVGPNRYVDGRSRQARAERDALTGGDIYDEIYSKVMDAVTD